MADLRQLPAVDKVLRRPDAERLAVAFGRDALRDALRSVLDEARAEALAGVPIPDEMAILQRAERLLQTQFAPTLRSVINATGVIVHTNLGRAPLSEAAQAAILEAAAGYGTLEFDLASGKRGKRDTHAEALVTAVTGAEAALVVNNNAAAVTLILAALARKREVIISRGQLVEIGGGFRMPDVMAQSGARMIEVGTTNKTRLEDFARAITANTALIMRVHASNFKQIGFTAQPGLAALAALAHERGILAVDDLGSGALLDTAAFGLAHEPTVQESLAAGFDLVAISGDKLLGGPQAGIIVGKRDPVAALKRHPLARAVRMDKLSLAGLVATLTHYRRDEALTHVPVWRMIATPAESVQARAEAWLWELTEASLGEYGQVVPTHATVGGGSLPGETLPSFALALSVPAPDAFLARLRVAPLPVIARITRDRVLLDPRTVFADQEPALVRAVIEALSALGPLSRSS